MRLAWNVFPAKFRLVFRPRIWERTRPNEAREVFSGIARNPGGFSERKRFLSLGDGHRVEVFQEGRYDLRSINVRSEPKALSLPSTPYSVQLVMRHMEPPRVVGPIPHVPLRGGQCIGPRDQVQLDLCFRSIGLNTDGHATRVHHGVKHVFSTFVLR